MTKTYKTTQYDKQIMTDMSKTLYQNVGMTAMAEYEIMELYENNFGISALDTSRGIFSRNEQIERLAQNVVFWEKLRDEYNHMDVKEAIKIPRFCYIIAKREEFNMSIYIKYHVNEPSIIAAVKARVLEIVDD